MAIRLFYRPTRLCSQPTAEGFIPQKRGDPINPFLRGARMETVHSILHDARVHSDWRDDRWDPKRHVLQSLQAALAPRPVVVGQGHQPDVEAPEIFDLGLRPPWPT